jgi:hypothetical protein
MLEALDEQVDHVRGPAGRRLILEYGDYECLPALPARGDPSACIRRGVCSRGSCAPGPLLGGVPASRLLVSALSGGSPNDHVDALIASALDANAADYLVTEDKPLRKRLGRALPALERRVLPLADAIELLDQLHPAAPEPPPLVDKRPCYAISLDDPIFASIRQDYVDFDVWFGENCQRGHREAFVIDGGGTLTGICILKDEDDEEYSRPLLRRRRGGAAC